MSQVETPVYTSFLDGLPNPHTSKETPIENIPLAWDMAHAMKPFEDRRVHWQEVINRLENDPHGIYGRTKRYKRELSPLIEEFRALGDGENDSEETELSEGEWLKKRVARFNWHSPSVIPNSFVTEAAKKLVKHYRTQSYVNAEAIHYSDVAPRNIEQIESELGPNGQEVFAPLSPEANKYQFRYFEAYEVPQSVKELESRLAELADIQRRKEAYLALARHFGGVVTEETVTRQDVLDLSELLGEHYVDIRLRGE